MAAKVIVAAGRHAATPLVACVAVKGVTTPFAKSLGLYRQCSGGQALADVAAVGAGSIADTVICTKPAYGDSIVNLWFERR